MITKFNIINKIIHMHTAKPHKLWKLLFWWTCLLYFWHLCCKFWHGSLAIHMPFQKHPKLLGPFQGPNQFVVLLHQSSQTLQWQNRYHMPRSFWETLPFLFGQLSTCLAPANFDVPLMLNRISLLTGSRGSLLISPVVSTWKRLTWQKKEINVVSGLMAI